TSHPGALARSAAGHRHRGRRASAGPRRRPQPAAAARSRAARRRSAAHRRPARGCPRRDRNAVGEVVRCTLRGTRGEPQMIVTVHDLWKRYGRFEALKGLDFAVPEGSAFALVGPNGAGKTTTIKILVNLLEPSRGHTVVRGVNSRALSPRHLADIGY